MRCIALYASPGRSAARLAALRTAETLGHSIVAISFQSRAAQRKVVSLANARNLVVTLDGPLDYLGRAAAVAAIARRENCTLLFCDTAMGPEGGGAVGPASAHLLDWNHCSAVSALEFADQHVVALRRDERGTQRIDCRDRVVLCMRPVAQESGERAETQQEREVERHEIAALLPDIELREERERLAVQLAVEAIPRAAELFSEPNSLLERLRADDLLGSE